MASTTTKTVLCKYFCFLSGAKLIRIRYKGSWEKDKQHGQGVEAWNDQSRYEGEYLNGKKCGKGIFTWKEGSRYQGDFSNNMLHGYGKFEEELKLVRGL